MQIGQILRAAASVALLAGCAPGANQPDLPQYGGASYRLGAGDQLRIITFGEAGLTGQFTVDDQGSIDLPLLGPVVAACVTPAMLGHTLAERLQHSGVLKDASVSVQVLAYRPIFVLGEVNKPGQYPYQPGMTMLTAVAVAGGFTYRAVESYASVVRTKQDGEAGCGGKQVAPVETAETGDQPHHADGVGNVTQGKVTPDSFLAPGDVVKVYERHF